MGKLQTIQVYMKYDLSTNATIQPEDGGWVPFAINTRVTLPP